MVKRKSGSRKYVLPAIIGGAALVVLANAAGVFGQTPPSGGPTTYNCVNGSCVPVSGSGGQYATLAACQAACGGGGGTGAPSGTITITVDHASLW